YVLEVRPTEVLCGAPRTGGLLHAAATLRQLIRANRTGATLPCLRIEDWPSLRWRCFQDDLTRGPSSRLATMKRDVRLGAYLRMNVWTYYMEYQYAWKKHPRIGPKDGSLTPEDLSALVKFAADFHVEVMGNQQSFGHFEDILRHEEYADLRETGSILNPLNEKTYRLLDEMYSEVLPLLPFELFNVCCDETHGLGRGPSKELAGKIGVGGVYVRHIGRVHKLVKGKYGKRMMMWGDIILRHPANLKDIPRDVIMLTWGYDARANFEAQIVPFARSGFDFFVCPGVSNWSRILPDFGTATTNIRNFVRDGAKHGAMGMLNTAWEDDGESLNAPKWHGHAWAAECAWNAATTEPRDFNRRIGAVLFGEAGDHFGTAVELLSRAHGQAGMNRMYNRRFWQNDFTSKGPPAELRRSAEGLLGIVRPAIEHLLACRKEAVANGELIDSFLLGARRMERIARRMLDAVETGEACARAGRAPRDEATKHIDRAESIIKASRDAHDALGKEFRRLWLAESKPYALDWTMNRYASLRQWHDGMLAKLADARKCIEAGKPPPTPQQLGLPAPAPPE
ncbi:MAG: family 20 glycosylhydrolase, partial [Phycisphaerae bacterium]